MVGLDYLAWGIIYFFLLWLLPSCWIDNEFSYLEVVGALHVAVVVVTVGVIILIAVIWAATHILM